ncbi:MAG: tRNA lysidine(34) synthetase TilS, partial [Solirubrobacterales bacterium]
LTAGAIERGLVVRPRRPGDRMRPAGLNGSKSLQDLFVDRKVPRRLRDGYPVVCAGDRIAWVPGIAIDQSAAAGSAAAAAAILTAART